MLYRDPKCVFVADNIGQADVVAAWLHEHGINAEVMNRETFGGMASALLTGMTGIEVWVADPAQADTAVRLLGEHAVGKVTARPSGPPLEVECEECGGISVFPGQERGTVQSCPQCGAYLDVEPLDGDEGSFGPNDPEDNEDGGRRSDAITDQGPGGITK